MKRPVRLPRDQAANQGGVQRRRDVVSREVRDQDGNTPIRQQLHVVDVTADRPFLDTLASDHHVADAQFRRG